MSPRSEVLESTIHALDPLVAHGGGWVPGKGDGRSLGFRLDTDRERVRIQIALREPGQHWDVNFAAAILAWSEAAMESVMPILAEIALRRHVSIAQEMPVCYPPVLAVLLLPPASHVPPDVLMATADLARCIAWTILAREGLAP